ncbi:MAG TPA: hypothetical protein VNA25_00305, partial [Phycisphaerae bacterium]|nr:hypothetical protein [Phycisphaerae bacterium]
MAQGTQEMFQVAMPEQGMPQSSSALIDELARIYRQPTWTAVEQATEAGRLKFAHSMGMADLVAYLQRWRAKLVRKRK